MFSLTGSVIVNCNITLSITKKWLIYHVNEFTGQYTTRFIYKDPSIYTSVIVVQPNTLPYGLYRFVFTATKDCLYSEIDTFVRIQPSGLMLSTLSQMTGMYGQLIGITRGTSQIIKFNPFLHTLDLDNLAVITSLTFKYACQVIDSNIEQGYPTLSNQIINLDDFVLNPSLNQSFLKCFNSTGFSFEYFQ